MHDHDCTIAEVVIYWCLTMEAWVQFQGSSGGICEGCGRWGEKCFVRDALFC